MPTADGELPVRPEGDVRTGGDVRMGGGVPTGGDGWTEGDVPTEGDVRTGGDVRTEGDLRTGEDVRSEGDVGLDGRELVEHARYARYLRELAQAAEPDEAALVAYVLRDEDAQMARSAVVQHFGRRAPGLLPQAGFPAWVARMTQAVGRDAFLTRRLRGWTLIRALVLSERWTADELVAADDWCQRTVVDLRTPAPPEALAVLAAWGRTKRIRSEAGRRLAGGGWR